MTNSVNFPTFQLILEGPDLVGKTTLYNKIHAMNGFKWNIQDRSTLSMLCYARLYGRDVELYRSRLDNELNNLNNRMIILLPPFEILEERYHQRGDEIQDLTSLKKLYEIFSEEAKLIQGRPTVMCLREKVTMQTILDYTSEWSYAIESSDAFNVGEIVRDTLHAVSEDELSLSATITYPALSSVDDSIMNNPLEGEYYKEIKQKIETTISNELAGNNPYNLPQGLSSRRFYYSADTCISSIHFMPRNSDLKVYATFRSTDVDKNAAIDLSFLQYLTHHINNKFNFKCSRVTLSVALNSAHIRTDVE